ncbi:MAG: hypothetical protein AAGC80_08290 [Rhodococcus sp. (in: high G+C Gram-positive bacteria)]
MKQFLTILAALLILGFTIAFWKVILAVALLPALAWGVYAVGVPSWRRRQGRALDRRNGDRTAIWPRGPGTDSA